MPQEPKYTKLKKGEKIKLHDVFLSDGEYLTMDKLGRLFGILVLGKEVTKEGRWFRKSP